MLQFFQNLYSPEYLQLVHDHTILVAIMWLVVCMTIVYVTYEIVKIIDEYENKPEVNEEKDNTIYVSF